MKTPPLSQYPPVSVSRTSWNGEPVEVIGVGAGDSTCLGPAAIRSIQNAQMLIGADHQLNQIDSHISKAQTKVCRYPTPIYEVGTLLTANEDKKIVMLASGDPLYFGIGKWLTSFLGQTNLVFHANVSSVQIACARLGISWDDVETVSLHGRPLVSLRSRLQANRFYAILPDRYSTPIDLAIELKKAGFCKSRIWVVQSIGSRSESINQYDMEALCHTDKTSIDPLHISILEVRGAGGVLPEFPGIPDKHFITEIRSPDGKGMISKREVRLNILSLLSPQAGDISWDVGAGCGAVSVEWARWNSLGKVFAIENNPERADCIQKNREKFGVVQNLAIVEGDAPQILSTLPKPTVIFIGGSQGELKTLLNYCWNKLYGGGRLVVSAVTERSRADIYLFSQQDHVKDYKTDWTELSISKSHYLKGNVMLRPNLPVLLVKFEKPLISHQ